MTKFSNEVLVKKGAFEMDAVENLKFCIVLIHCRSLA